MFHRLWDFKNTHLLPFICLLFFLKCSSFSTIQWFCQSHGADKYFPATSLESSIMWLWRMRHFMLQWIQGMVFLWVGRRSQSSIDFFGVYSFIVKGIIDEFFTFNPWGLLFLSPAPMVCHNVFVIAPAVKESPNPKNTHSHTLKITKQTYSDKPPAPRVC